MPEQNEWRPDIRSQSTPPAQPAVRVDWTPAVATTNPHPSGHVDGDDYTWQGKPVQAKSAQVIDCRTLDQKMIDRMQALETTVGMLVDEVQHLRDDIARMRTGESQL